MKTLLTFLIAGLLQCSYGQETARLTMKSLYRKPIIEADVNGKRAFFLVDTGSDISIINTSVIKKYRLERVKLSRGKCTAMAFDGSVAKLCRIKGARVSLTSRFIHTTFYGLDLDTLTDSIQSKTNLRIAGILGADLLLKYDCIIDYANKEMVLRSKTLTDQIASNR